MNKEQPVPRADTNRNVYMMNQKTFDAMKDEFDALGLEAKVNPLLENFKVYIIQKEMLEEPFMFKPSAYEEQPEGVEVFEESKVTKRYWELLENGHNTRSAKRKLKREFGPGYTRDLNLPQRPEPQGLIAIPNDIPSYRISNIGGKIHGKLHE